MTAVSQGDPQAQGGHPGHEFRRHPAGEQGRSLPPPAPPASLSLFRSEDWVSGRRSGRASEPGKFYSSTEQEKKGPIPQPQEVFFPTGARFSEATDLSCHLSLVSLASFQERPTKYRGARTEVIGKISYMTNSALVLRHDTLEVTGPSYPIGFVPDRTQESGIPDRVRR